MGPWGCFDAGSGSAHRKRMNFEGLRNMHRWCNIRETRPFVFSAKNRCLSGMGDPQCMSVYIHLMQITSIILLYHDNMIQKYVGIVEYLVSTPSDPRSCCGAALKRLPRPTWAPHRWMVWYLQRGVLAKPLQSMGVWANNGCGYVYIYTYEYPYMKLWFYINCYFNVINLIAYMFGIIIIVNSDTLW